MSASSMTRRTARELLNLILGNESPPELCLIRRFYIVNAKDRVPRPHVLLRVAMAIETPFHLQGGLLPHQRHPVDRAVARRAADALVKVDAVIEVHEIWEVVDPRPQDGRAGPKAGANRFEKRAVREDLRVAIHAGLGRRNARKRRVFDR